MEEELVDQVDAAAEVVVMELFAVMDVGTIAFNLPSPSPELNLVEAAAPFRSLSIYVAIADAQILASAKDQTPLARPSTHDLFVATLARLRCDVVAVRITNYDEGIFYGEIELMTPEGSMTMDSRVSDGVVIALRTGAQILCAEKVLNFFNP